MKKLFVLLFLFPLLVQAREVSVDNAFDLFQAIAPNTTIRVAPGDYNFSTLNEGTSTDYANFSGGEVYIKEIRNLTIIGEGYAELGTEDPYSNVFRFTDCQDISLENLIMGHFIEKGYCEGSVVSFHGCMNVSIVKSVMYGSGTYGIQAFDVDGLKVSNSVIKDCSYGTVYMQNVSNVEFRNTQFKRCQAGLSFRGASRLILFDNCYFSGIKDFQDWSKWNEDAKYLFFFDPQVESVLLKNNRFENNGTTALLSRQDDVTVKGSTGSKNAFELK